MDGFTYTNIFETKGIEYLVIIAFFAILIPFWTLLNRKKKQSNFIQKTPGFITASSLQIPQGLFFSKHHAWAYMEKNGNAKVGLDDLLLHLTGEVKITHLKKAGDKIQRGDLLTQITHNGKNLKILAPVSGEIQENNQMLTDDNSLLLSAPYSQGWLYLIKPTNWKADTDSCYLAEDATYWATRELERFKDFLSASVARHLPNPTSVVLQDGGELIDQPLAALPEEVWQDFQDTFLK